MCFGILIVRYLDPKRLGRHFFGHFIFRNAVVESKPDIASVFIAVIVFQVTGHADRSAGKGPEQQGSIGVFADGLIPTDIIDAKSLGAAALEIFGNEQACFPGFGHRKKAEWNDERGRDASQFKIGHTRDDQFVGYYLQFFGVNTEVRMWIITGSQDSVLVINSIL